MFHFRSARGPEVDLVIQNGLSIIGCEVKSGATVDESFLRPLRRFKELLAESAATRILRRRDWCSAVTGRQTRAGTECVGWRDLHRASWLKAGSDDSSFLS